jgi:hypothetical protein
VEKPWKNHVFVENDGLKRCQRWGKPHLYVNNFTEEGTICKTKSSKCTVWRLHKIFWFLDLFQSTGRAFHEFKKTKRPVTICDSNHLDQGLHRLQFSPSVSRSCPQSKIHWKSKVSIRKTVQ